MRYWINRAAVVAVATASFAGVLFHSNGFSGGRF
jgi:hypothetical protein